MNFDDDAWMRNLDREIREQEAQAAINNPRAPPNPNMKKYVSFTFMTVFVIVSIVTYAYADFFLSTSQFQTQQQQMQNVNPASFAMQFYVKSGDCISSMYTNFNFYTCNSLPHFSAQILSVAQNVSFYYLSLSLNNSLTTLFHNPSQTNTSGPFYSPILSSQQCYLLENMTCYQNNSQPYIFGVNNINQINSSMSFGYTITSSTQMLVLGYSIVFFICALLAELLMTKRKVKKREIQKYSKMLNIPIEYKREWKELDEIKRFKLDIE